MVLGWRIKELWTLLGCPVPRGSDPPCPPAHPQSEVQTCSPHRAGSGCPITPQCCRMGAGSSAGATGGLSLSHRGEETPSSIAMPKMLLSTHSQGSQGPQWAGSSGWPHLPPQLFKLTVINDLLKMSLSLSEEQIHPLPAQTHQLMGRESWSMHQWMAQQRMHPAQRCTDLGWSWARMSEVLALKALPQWGRVGLVLLAQLTGGTGWEHRAGLAVGCG